MKLLTMLDNPAIIVAAAASGDMATLQDFLSKYPAQVCIVMNALLNICDHVHGNQAFVNYDIWAFKAAVVIY